MESKSGDTISGEKGISNPCFHGDKYRTRNSELQSNEIRESSSQYRE